MRDINMGMISENERQLIVKLSEFIVKRIRNGGKNNQIASERLCRKFVEYFMKCINKETRKTAIEIAWLKEQPSCYILFKKVWLIFIKT